MQHYILNLLFSWTFICVNVLFCLGQETVFSGLKSNLKRADRYYQNQSFKKALELYILVEEKGKGQAEVPLQIARSYYRLNESLNAVEWYQRYLETETSLPAGDDYNYAEALASAGNYEEAIAWYIKCQERDPGNSVLLEKIWRLKNIQYLYDDSIYVQVKPVDLNTDHAEYGPAYFEDGLVLVSDRKDKKGTFKLDPITNRPFQSLYFFPMHFDSVYEEVGFGKMRPFLKESPDLLNVGPLSYRDNKLIFTRSTVAKNGNESTLKLYWVDRIDNTWKNERPFEYNNDTFSVSHPSLSHDGKTLVFVSDMPSGRGGKDLYISYLTKDGWTIPLNLGPEINTAGDETAPFVYSSNTLYFASNGLGGFGGLDVFKIPLSGDNQMETQNLGYPVNTSFDDFGLIVNKDGTHGFLASNRKMGGFDDDIYEVFIDIQTYPLVINGTVKYNDPDWGISSRLEVLSEAKLELIDNIRNVTVYETNTDLNGNFSLEIPYASMFKIKVSQKDFGEALAGLEIPRNRKMHTNHEIVVVKQKFNENKKDKEFEASMQKNATR